MVTVTQHPNETTQTSDPVRSSRNVASILLERANSQHPAVVEPEQSRSFTYAELAQLAKDFTTQLQQRGLRPQDRIAVLLPTSIELEVSAQA